MLKLEMDATEISDDMPALGGYFYRDVHDRALLLAVVIAVFYIEFGIRLYTDEHDDV